MIVQKSAIEITETEFALSRSGNGLGLLDTQQLHKAALELNQSVACSPGVKRRRCGGESKFSVAGYGGIQICHGNDQVIEAARHGRQRQIPAL